ncbi:hypothetical protein V1289_001986 [Bradyrhizobium sp. AZCC 2289]
MTHTFHELVIGGVLVAPFISYAVAALFVILTDNSTDPAPGRIFENV